MLVQDKSADLMSAREEVQRIDRVGSLWFAATVLASSIALLGLVTTGFHPASLGGDGEIAWWIGATLNALGLGALGYAGCPIYWGSVETAHRQKSVAIRAGLALYLLGGWVAIIALLN